MNEGVQSLGQNDLLFSPLLHFGLHAAHFAKEFMELVLRERMEGGGLEGLENGSASLTDSEGDNLYLPVVLPDLTQDVMDLVRDAAEPVSEELQVVH